MDEKILLNRIDKLKERMKNKGIDTALITKDENKFYLTNFRSSHFFVIITGSKNYLLTDFRYIELAKALEPLFSVVLITGESDELDFLKELKSCGVLGFEENGTTLHEFLNLKNLFGHEQLLEMDGELQSLRMIKDGYEKTCIKEAA
ncbi:MAG: aminopeptidase P family N-terminal domain-containing protein, partial [Anaerovorax sp.]